MNNALMGVPEKLEMLPSKLDAIFHAVHSARESAEKARNGQNSRNGSLDDRRITQRDVVVFAAGGGLVWAVIEGLTRLFAVLGQ